MGVGRDGENLEGYGKEEEFFHWRGCYEAAEEPMLQFIGNVNFAIARHGQTRRSKHRRRVILEGIVRKLSIRVEQPA